MLAGHGHLGKIGKTELLARPLASSSVLLGFAKVAVTSQQELMKNAHGHRRVRAGVRKDTSHGTGSRACARLRWARLTFIFAGPHLFFFDARALGVLQTLRLVSDAPRAAPAACA